MVDRKNLAAVPGEESADPFDVDKIRETPMDDIGVEKVLLTVTVRRPNRNEFFRVHPDPGMTVDWYAIEERTTTGPRNLLGDHENFVRPPRRNQAGADLRVRQQARHAVSVARTTSEPDNRLGRRWHESALEIAEQAKTLWVKMVGQRDAGTMSCFGPEVTWGILCGMPMLKIFSAGVQRRSTDRLDGSSGAAGVGRGDVVFGLPFSEIWALDFEFISESGARPSRSAWSPTS